MALKSQTRNCSGIQISSVQLPALRSFKLMAKLGRVVAPVLSLQGIDLQADASELVPALTGLFAALAAEDLDVLAPELLASTQALVVNEDNGASGQIDLGNTSGINLAFGGNLAALLGAMRLAIEVNYLDFIQSVLPAAEIASSLPAVSDSDSTTTSETPG